MDLGLFMISDVIVELIIFYSMNSIFIFCKYILFKDICENCKIDNKELWMVCFDIMIWFYLRVVYV